MAEITAAMVGQLRAKTDAPMMECKKALVEAGGNIEKAEEILRVRLGTKASKASTRITAEGVIAAYIDGGRGALVEVNCETDFVTTNEGFVKLADMCAKLVAEKNPADVNALSALSDGGKTVDEIRTELVGRIGENMSVRRFARYETTAKLACYLHNKRIGVMVEFEGADDQVGRDVAMHIAAMKPVALSAEAVPAELIERERSVALQKANEDAAKAAAEGKKPQSADILAKRIEGSVQKYLKEVSLLNQPFVKNDKQSVGQMLKEAGATVQSFTMFVVGEGLEKKEDNFAAEVAAQVAAAKQA
ncbi:MAG: translation elongation factor Ts [Alistipes senegalensis]|nr:translation elongation factor Ts [Oxalobacter formigenes]MCM1281200.1 translation elongation factor Ts [Alistipes senegalensis]